jgi:poly(hydroxyalkanoate) granule-associated protein
MTKKLKAAVADNMITTTIKGSAQQVWMASMGAFDKAQQGGNKVFEALMREGEMIQEKTRRVTGDTVAGVTAKATHTWDRIEQVFEQRVAVALHSLGVPTRKEVQTLCRKVKELTAQVERLQGDAPKAVRRSKKKTD